MTTTMTNVSTARAAVKRKTQILRITLAVTILAFITFLITLTLSSWVTITYPPNFFATRHKKFVTKSTYGIIWECILGKPTINSPSENTCDYHHNQLQNQTIPAEQTLVEMVRGMLSFSVIHIILTTITFICGLYSIRDYRYTYKRLTGMLYTLAAVSLLVCLEVLMKIWRYTHKHFPDIYPPTAQLTYGPCYIISWINFSLLLVSSFVFFACSRKRKGTFDEATEEEAMANRPVDLGRSFR